MKINFSLNTKQVSSNETVKQPQPNTSILLALFSDHLQNCSKDQVKLN